MGPQLLRFSQMRCTIAGLTCPLAAFDRSLRCVESFGIALTVASSPVGVSELSRAAGSNQLRRYQSHGHGLANGVPQIDVLHTQRKLLCRPVPDCGVGAAQCQTLACRYNANRLSIGNEPGVVEAHTPSHWPDPFGMGFYRVCCLTIGAGQESTPQPEEK